MKKQLSIVVPVYNCAKYLPDCIDSLLCQKLDNYEIILIDDGSLDNSGAICDEYGNKYECVKVIHKNNEGQGIARNLGISVSEGTYIAFVDSDDYVNRNAYNQLIQLMDEFKLDMCIGKIKICKNFEKDKNKSIQNYCNKKIYRKKAINNLITYMFADYDGKNQISSSSCDKIYKKKLLNDGVNFKSERLYISEDIIFNFEYMQKCNRIMVTDIEFYNYIQHDDSFCHKYQPEYLERLLKSSNYFMSSQFIKKEISRKLFSYLKSCIIQEIEFNSVMVASKKVKYFINRDDVRNILIKVNTEGLGKNNTLLLFLLKVKCVLVTTILYKIKLKKDDKV